VLIADHVSFHTFSLLSIITWILGLTKLIQTIIRIE